MTELPLISLQQVRRYEQVPRAQRFPLDTIPALLHHACERYADQPAIQLLMTGEPGEIPGTIHYHQLHDSILRAHQVLWELGFGRGQVLSLLLPILPETQILTFAAQCSGIANPLNPLLEAEHLAGIINAVGARVLAACAPELDPEGWTKVEYLLRECPSVRCLLVVGLPDRPLDSDLFIDLPKRVLPVDYRARMAETEAVPLREVPRAEDVAAYFHTGGTTGRPKIARLTQANFAFVAQAMRDVTALPECHTQLNGLPLFHIYGAMAAGLASFIHGCRVVHLTPAGFRTPAVIRNFWPLVAEHRANVVPVVPTLFGLLLDAEVDGLDLSCLWEMGSGAAPLPEGLKRRFEARFDLRIAEGYGMTESCCLIARGQGSPVPAECAAPAGSVGLPIPYTEIRIATLGGGEPSPLNANEVGNILISGPNVFAGYLQEDDNRGVWYTDDEGHRWFDTGDCGYLDTEGRLFITGRAKDLIIRGGHNIDPQLIEEPLRGHSAVADVVAVGMPDAHAGELPVAFVQPCAGAEVDETQLLAFAAQHIRERAAVPKRIFLVSEMPLTAVGKIFKPELRRRALAFAAAELLRGEGIEAQVEARLESGSLRLSIHMETGLAAQAKDLLEQLPVALTLLDIKTHSTETS
ncbi:AMP-binding protein [Microbulbifer pacificus]|uniref:AMP-binding protein n=1 Tax=Microbulbifer pacificus TaxID=407164 RepID=UPI001F1BA12B|nr:AMP-binding protein [Microbulbifer pacificus]